MYFLLNQAGYAEGGTISAVDFLLMWYNLSGSKEEASFLLITEIEAPVSKRAAIFCLLILTEMSRGSCVEREKRMGSVAEGVGSGEKETC